MAQREAPDEPHVFKDAVTSVGVLFGEAVVSQEKIGQTKAAGSETPVPVAALMASIQLSGWFPVPPA